jgi:integrase/recombinase XerD
MPADLVAHKGSLGSPISNSDELAAAYLAGFSAATRRAYEGDLRCWGSFLSSVGVGVLEAHRVHGDAWVRTMEATGLAASTIARRLAAVGGFYAYAVDEGLIGRSPLLRVKRPRVSDESPRLGLDTAELARLLEVAESSNARDHALVSLLAFNGLRISEALAADVEALSWERGHRTLALLRKGGKRATAPLAPRTAAAIEALFDGREAGPIFATRTGRRLDRQSAHKIVCKLARRAGIAKAISAHSFRHGFVTTALDAGASLRDVQDAAGHADPRTTRRYDRARQSLDRHPTYAVAAAVA